MARFVAPGFPHHVTQRGVRRMDVFSCDDDYRVCLSLLKESCDLARLIALDVTWPTRVDFSKKIILARKKD